MSDTRNWMPVIATAIPMAYVSNGSVKLRVRLPHSPWTFYRSELIDDDDEDDEPPVDTTGESEDIPIAGKN